MAYILEQLQNTGNKIQTTYIWDPGEIASVDVTSEEFKELLTRLNEFIGVIQLNLNAKVNGQRPQEEFLVNKEYPVTTSFNQDELRSCFQKTFIIGALGAGVTNIAHGLTPTATWNFVSFVGAATDNIGNNYYPLPFPSAGGAANIEVRATATNIVITNNSGINFTSAILTVEFLKS